MNKEFFGWFTFHNPSRFKCIFIKSLKEEHTAENSTLEQLIDPTKEALIQAGASNYYQSVFKTLTKQLLLYAEKHDTDSFSMDFGLQFLEEHYSMSSKIKQKKWCAAYSRCINALAEYQCSGNVTLYLVMDKRAYTFPEGWWRRSPPQLCPGGG